MVEHQTKTYCAMLSTGVCDKEARIAALEEQLAEAKAALTAIDGLEVMEINPSNYDHDDVCALNRDASQASCIARAALEAAPPSPQHWKNHESR